MLKPRSIAAVTLAASIALACGACSSGAADSGNTSGSNSSTGEEIANPWTDVDSLDEAAKLVGFELEVPDAIDGYDTRTIQVMDNEIVQVLYTASGSEDEICIRKAPESVDDVSGDHNNYQETSLVTVDGREVGLMGDDGTVSLAGWFEGDYVYSIGAYGTALTAEQVEELVAQVK